MHYLPRLMESLVRLSLLLFFFNLRSKLIQPRHRARKKLISFVRKLEGLQATLKTVKAWKFLILESKSEKEFAIEYFPT